MARVTPAMKNALRIMARTECLHGGHVWAPASVSKIMLRFLTQKGLIETAGNDQQGFPIYFITDAGDEAINKKIAN